MLDNAQQTFSSNAPPPRQRQSSGLASSIWAPQPQPSDKTWPRKLDSFSRTAEDYMRDDSRYDVFGPQLALNQAGSRLTRDIGAIGDGRKRISPGDYDDSVRFFSSRLY